jgi:hypothetical protein
MAGPQGLEPRSPGSKPGVLSIVRQPRDRRASSICQFLGVPTGVEPASARITAVCFAVKLQYPSSILVPGTGVVPANTRAEGPFPVGFAGTRDQRYRSAASLHIWYRGRGLNPQTPDSKSGGSPDGLPLLCRDQGPFLHGLAPRKNPAPGLVRKRGLQIPLSGPALLRASPTES